MTAKTFQCPNCGSALTTEGGEREVQCPFCRSSVIVPNELSGPAQPARRSFANVFLKDDFSDPSSGWEPKEKNQNYTTEYKDGHYHIAIQPNYPHARTMFRENFTDCSVEMDVQKIAGEDFSLIGVIARGSDDGYYSFEFDYRGHIGIFQADSSFNSTKLIVGHYDPTKIDPKGVNHIQGICDGQNLSIVLNGQFVAEVQNSTFKEGGIGFTVNPGKAGNAVEVLFSNFVVKGP